jgi:hypothetical protein
VRRVRDLLDETDDLHSASSPSPEGS